MICGRFVPTFTMACAAHKGCRGVRRGTGRLALTVGRLRPPKQERIATASAMGTRLSMGTGALRARYYPLFHDATTKMVTQYGVNQFKLDGTGNADQVVKACLSSDFDALFI